MDKISPKLSSSSERGFKLARIQTLYELETGAYWPQLQRHFL